ncbi:hypothetical protein YYC_04942 [Plasmodium yoelii 17X]|uniref:Uncharacterized protein n=1 Tax=Plasmodium yoelii 17X TaxID=1323249 RepID=V7PC41_PLAYE|nr:hypothetical protein YYC_04942 [Plasmodium yoelii 17X]
MNINSFIIWYTLPTKSETKKIKNNMSMYLCKYIYNHINEANAYYFNYNIYIDIYVFSYFYFLILFVFFIFIRFRIISADFFLAPPLAIYFLKQYIFFLKYYIFFF